MTRPWLRPNDKGIYICEHSALEGQIHARMQPAPARDRWFWLRASGYFAATMLAGLGILVGLLIMCGFAAVFWGIDRMRKVWK